MVSVSPIKYTIASRKRENLLLLETWLWSMVPNGITIKYAIIHTLSKKRADLESSLDGTLLGDETKGIDMLITTLLSSLTGRSSGRG